MRLHFHNRVPRGDCALGIAVARGVSTAAASPQLQAALEVCISERTAPLPDALEQRRNACRQLLRNGSYKPTGRGKPASEYLLRAAIEGHFPSINALVDANNLVSLQHLVPISLWDTELAGAHSFEFRLGLPEERYVFNPAGQVLELCDLIGGFAERPTGTVPIVNPVKDSLLTKTTADTRNVAACIYFPWREGAQAQLQVITKELYRWLLLTHHDAQGQWGIALPGQTYATQS
jgi:DNA/RNA-binding domain of Phe-tRNA-synthetase-like protein